MTSDGREHTRHITVPSAGFDGGWGHTLFPFRRYDADDRPVVVELKRRRVGPSAASQLQRYVDALDEEFPGEEVRGILVAPSVTDRAAALLDERGLEFVALDPVGEDGDHGRSDDSEHVGSGSDDSGSDVVDSA